MGVKVKELQEELTNTEIEAESADGGVTVTISGSQVPLDVTVTEELLASTIRDKDAAAAGAAAADTPKYINSPESAVFKKGKLLYGMHLAQREIRRAKRALVVEGYMDVIAMHAAGLPYAVACLGTAVSEEQIELAASPIGVAPTAAGEAANGASAAAAPAARTVVLALDGDDAGSRR